MNITFVKKILADGNACKKCADVEKRLQDSDYMQYIDTTIVADERDPDSEGMQLARQHNMSRAPFFIVEDGDSVQVYDIYFQLVKEVLEKIDP